MLLFSKKNLVPLFTLLYVSIYLLLSSFWAVSNTPTIKEICRSDFNGCIKDFVPHIPSMYKSRKIFKDPDLTAKEKIICLTSVSTGTGYTPLCHIIFGLINTLSQDFSYLNIRLFSIFLLITLFFIIYKLGAFLSNDLGAAMSVIFFSVFPITYSLILNNPIFLMTALFVTISMYYLFKSDYLSNKLNFILFVVFFCLAFLVKQDSLLYILPPFSYVVYRYFKNLRTSLLNKACFILICVLAAAILFFFNKNIFVPMVKNIFMRMNFHESMWGPGIKWYSPVQFFYYVNYLFAGLTPLYFIGCFSACILTRLSDNKYILLSWIIIPLIFLSLMPLKYPQYLSPVIPPIALIMGSTIARYRKVWIVFFSFAVLTFISFLTLYFTLFPFGSIKIKPSNFPEYHLPCINERYAHDEIFKVLEQNNVKDNILVLFYKEPYSFCYSLKLYSLIYKNNSYKFWAPNELHPFFGLDKKNNITAIIHYTKDPEFHYFRDEERLRLLNTIESWKHNFDNSYLSLELSGMSENFYLAKSIKISPTHYAYILLRRKSVSGFEP